MTSYISYSLLFQRQVNPSSNMLKRLTNLFKPKLVTLENKNKRLNPEDFLRQLEWTTLRRLDGQLQGRLPNLV